MAIVAARSLSNDDVCFVGIGAPSTACNLARLTHAPDIVLIYESGTIGTRPSVLPLSIGDGELCETALTTVSGIEMFRYWLQGGRIPLGFLGAAQVDARGNINTTVIGPYERPNVRLPGGGGAPEIATLAKQVTITARQDRRSFVPRIDFRTSLGFGQPGESRADYGVETLGPTKLVTDLAVWQMQDADGRTAHHSEFKPKTASFVVVSLYPGVARADVNATVGWPVRFAEKLVDTAPASQLELEALRELQARTRAVQERGS